jgi:hypothetical protein
VEKVTVTIKADSPVQYFEGGYWHQAKTIKPFKMTLINTKYGIYEGIYEGVRYQINYHNIEQGTK